MDTFQAVDVLQSALRNSGKQLSDLQYCWKETPAQVLEQLFYRTLMVAASEKNFLK